MSSYSYNHLTLALAFVLASILALTACGGGSVSGNTNTRPPGSA